MVNGPLRCRYTLPGLGPSLWRRYTVGWMIRRRTAHLFGSMSHGLVGLGTPWPLLGDFNIGAADMRDVVCGLDLGNLVRVMSPGITCLSSSGTGSAIDCGGGQTLATWFGGMRSCDSSLATHRPVLWDLRWHWTQSVEVVHSAARIPATRNIGPASRGALAEDWALLKDIQGAVARYGGQVVQSDRPDVAQQAVLQRLLLRWQERARFHIGFCFGCADTEYTVDPKIGCGLEFGKVDPVSLVSGRNPMCRKTHKAHALKWCVRRLQEAKEGYALDVNGQWWHRWKALTGRWCKEGLLTESLVSEFMSTWDQWPSNSLVSEQASVALIHFTEVWKEANTQCERLATENWNKVKEQVRAGDPIGFRMIKERHMEVWDGESDVSNVALLKGQSDKWATLWTDGQGVWSPWHMGMALGGTRVDLPLSAAEIRAAAKSFKLRTTAVEGWHPRHFAALPDESLTGLGLLWHLFEVAVWWPDSEAELLAKLIPKPKGGLRPIMWFRSCYRVFARARRSKVQEWFRPWAADRPEVNMAPGRHTTDAIWRAMVRQDLAMESEGSRRSHFVEWNWDFQKAFDHVDRTKLWARAAKVGYPLSILATSLCSYGWGRRFVLNREVSAEIRAQRGIAAGSPFAPYELAVHLDGLVDLVRHWNTLEECKACLSIHVDDVSVLMEGEDPDTLVEAAGRLARHMDRHISELGMKLDLGDKAFVLASDETLLTKATKELGTLGGSAVVSVRKLGVDYGISGKGRKVRKVLRSRLISGCGRFAKIRRFGLVRQCPRLVMAGLIPLMSFGAELYSATKAELRSLGKVCAHAGLGRPLGVARHVPMALQQAGQDEAFVFVKAAVVRWAREVWLLGSRSAPGDCLSAREVRGMAGLIADSAAKGIRIRNGPVCALASALDSLGWVLTGAGGSVHIARLQLDLDVRYVSPKEICGMLAG